MKTNPFERLTMQFVKCQRADPIPTIPRAVKQYHKSKKDTEKIADQQAERYRSIPDDDKEDDEQ